MKIYFIRHGQSEDDKNNICQNNSAPLSEVGVNQIEHLANELTKIEGFCLLISSSLIRAKETSRIIGKKLDLKIKIVNLVEEMVKSPILKGLNRNNFLIKKYKKELKKINPCNIKWKFEGTGESLQDVFSRVVEFKKILKNKYKNKNKNILVISHKTFISCFVVHCLLEEKIDGLPLRNIINSIQIDNGSISCVEYIEKNNKWKIKYLNTKSLY